MSCSATYRCKAEPFTNWPLGPDGRCAACHHWQQYHALCDVTADLDRHDNQAQWSIISAALDAFWQAGAELIEWQWSRAKRVPAPLPAEETKRFVEQQTKLGEDVAHALLGVTDLSALGRAS